LTFQKEILKAHNNATGTVGKLYNGRRKKIGPQNIGFTFKLKLDTGTGKIISRHGSGVTAN